MADHSKSVHGRLFKKRTCPVFGSPLYYLDCALGDRLSMNQQICSSKCGFGELKYFKYWQIIWRFLLFKNYSIFILYLTTNTSSNSGHKFDLQKILFSLIKLHNCDLWFVFNQILMNQLYKTDVFLQKPKAGQVI